MTTENGATRNFRRNLIRYGGDVYPEIVEKAQGCYVWDATGKKILDFTSGQMCATVGHSHPNIVAAIKNSCDTALHLFSGMIPRSVVQLAEALSRIVPRPLRKSLFLNTGSESNDAAIKMAKLYTGGFEVIGLGGSWHGVTGNAGSVSFASDRKGYGPGMPGSFVIPEPNAYRCPVKHCRDKCDCSCMAIGFEMYDMQSTGAPAAVIAEPVISAGGVIVPPDGYFAALQAEAKKRGMLLIFDEAQTAFGRLGHWFASTHLGVTPDIMTVSKTLGGGMPLAGVITNDDLEEVCHQRGFAFYTSHVSDPLPATVGLAVLETIEQEHLLERSREMGAYLAARLSELQSRHAEIGDVRGMGLLRGIELVKDRETREPYHELGAMTTRRCMELGLSMNIRRRPERGSVWRIAPPLTVSAADIDLAMTIFDQALVESKDVLAKRPGAAVVMIGGMSVESSGEALKHPTTFRRPPHNLSEEENMLKKFVSIVATGMVLAMLGTTAAIADVLSDIKKRGVLVVGTKPDYRPFGFLDPSGKIVGLEPDLAADVAKRLGVKLELVPVVAANRIQFLQQGKIDLIIATMSDTPERRKIVDFVDPNHYGSGLNVLALKSARLTNWGELKGKKVCLIQGAFYNRELQEKYGVEGVAFQGTAEVYAALRNGNCVGFAYDDTAIVGEILKPEWGAYEMPLDSILFVPWGIAAKQGEKALVEFMSKTVVDWHKTGLIQQLEKKWGIKATKFTQDMNAKYK